jgi:hypothetical protein
MFQRDISEQMVEDVVKNGKIIEKYLDDKPYPSFLALAFIEGQPMHVVYAKNEQDKYIIITVYKPTLNKWMENFEKRRL